MKMPRRQVGLQPAPSAQTPPRRIIWVVGNDHQAAAVSPAQTGPPPPSSLITEGSKAPWRTHMKMTPW